jgi:hypothetical protein
VGLVGLVDVSSWGEIPSWKCWLKLCWLRPCSLESWLSWPCLSSDRKSELISPGLDDAGMSKGVKKSW